MKMKIERKDIDKIQIEDIKFGNDHGCYSGLADFETDIDELTQGDDITIKISGTCAYYDHSHNGDLEWAFKGTLAMSEDDFMQEYKYAIEDEKGYITFDGEAEIKPSADVSVDDNIEDTYDETIYGLYSDISDIIGDGSDTIYNVIKFVLKESADKIIEEIKRIDNKDLDKDECEDYVLDNIIKYSGKLLDDKYESIGEILLAKISEKSDKLDELINNEINEIIDGNCETKYDITAKVYFSDL